jgi:hypothetical protein
MPISLSPSLAADLTQQVEPVDQRPHIKHLLVDQHVEHVSPFGYPVGLENSTDAVIWDIMT